MGLIAENRFFLFWSSLGAIGFLLIWNLPWRFQVNDDTIMMWLVSGAFTGSPETYTLFIHPFLTWILSKFYSWQPEINWYGATWFLVIALCFFLVIKKISLLASDTLNKSFLAFFVLLISFHFCFFPQFTLVAGFAAFSSLLFWTSEIPKSSDWVKKIALGVFVLGILIRWESVALVGLGYGLFVFLSSDLNWSKSRSIQFLTVVLLFSSLLGAKFLWERNSDYSDFLKFNRIRSGVIDHPIFRQEVIDKEILAGSDFYFFSRWFFEGEHPSEAQLIEKKKELDSKFFSIDQVINSFERLWVVQKVEAFKSFLIVFILILFASSYNRAFFLPKFFWIWSLFFLLFNHFFLIQGRVIFLFFLCLMIPALNGYYSKFRKNYLIFAFAFCSLIFGYHSLNFIKEAKGRAVMDNEFIELKSSLDPSIPLIFEGYQEHNLGLKYSVHNPVPFLTTGWISRSNFQKKALKRFGIGGFQDITRFALITPTVNTEILFPAYMNHEFGEFQLLDSVRTDNFILFQFSKK